MNTLKLSLADLDILLLCGNQDYLTTLHSACKTTLRQNVENWSEVGLPAFGAAAAISTISNLLYNLPGYNESLECVANLRRYVGLNSPQAMVQYLETNSLSCAMVNYCSLAKTILVGTGVILGVYGLAKQFLAPSEDELEVFDSQNYMKLVEAKFTENANYLESTPGEKSVKLAQIILNKKNDLVKEVANLKLRNVTVENIEKSMSPLFDAAVKKLSPKKEEKTEMPKDAVESNDE